MRDEDKINSAQNEAKKIEQEISSIVKNIQKGVALTIENATKNIGKGKQKKDE